MVREVGPEAAQVVAGRPEVVVDDVEDHREAAAMGGIDKTDETLWPAVRVMWRVQVDAVIAPAAIAAELVDRHQLHVRDAQVDEVVETGDRAVECPFIRKRPDVQLVDDRAGEGWWPEVRIVPLERSGVDDP